MPAGRLASVGQRVGDGARHRVARYARRLDRLSGEPLPLGEQAEHEVQAGDVLLAALAGGVLRLEDDHLGPVGESVQVRLRADEALLHGLLADPHALADGRPRRAERRAWSTKCPTRRSASSSRRAATAAASVRWSRAVPSGRSVRTRLTSSSSVMRQPLVDVRYTSTFS